MSPVKIDIDLVQALSEERLYEDYLGLWMKLLHSKKYRRNPQSTALTASALCRMEINVSKSDVRGFFC